MIDYKINGRTVTKEEWDNKEFRLITIDNLSNVIRPKDQLWNFVDTLNFEKPIQITSKRQWERECNKRNLMYVGKGEVGRAKPRKFESVPIETKKNLIREEMKKLGIYDSRKLFKRR